MLSCGRIHLGPVKRTALTVFCQCCGKSMTTKERAAYIKIRFRVYEIMLLARLAISVKNERLAK